MRQPTTPSSIVSAFEAVGREVPAADRLVRLSEALERHEDADRLCVALALPRAVGSLGSSFILTNDAEAYRAALAEAADPAVYAVRLLNDANDCIRWAIKADREAASRQECADNWAAKGDERMAGEYASRARSEATYAAVCRASAKAKRAQASALMAPVRVAA